MTSTTKAYISDLKVLNDSNIVACHDDGDDDNDDDGDDDDKEQPKPDVKAKAPATAPANDK